MVASLTVQAQRDFSNQLRPLASECSELGRQWGRYNTPLTSDEFKIVSSRFKHVAARCQSLLEQASEMFGDFMTLNAWAEKHSHKEDLDEFVIPYALCLESENLTRLSHWMGDDLEALREKEDMSAINNTRRLSTNIPFKGTALSHESAPIEPKLLHKGQFRHAALHKRTFLSGVESCIQMIIDDSRGNVPESAKWINLIHETTSAAPSTGMLIEKLLKEKLMSAPTEGLEALRHFALGNHKPSGSECSGRARRLFDEVVYSEVLGANAIAIQLSSIRLNPQYVEHVMFDDLIDTIGSRCDHYDSNERGDTYDEGTGGARKLTDLFKLLDLSDQQLCTIAMHICAGFNRGHIMDMSNQSLIDQLSSVLNSKSFVQATCNPEENLRHAVLAAVLRSLPIEVVREASQTSDSCRVSTYKLTGNEAFLKGLQDRKLADSLISADLGL